MKKSLLKDRVFGALNEQSGPCTSGCCKFQSLKVNCPNGNPPGCGGSNAAYGGQPSRCNFIDGNPPVVGDEFIIPTGGLANCIYKVISVHENGPKPLNKNFISGVCPPPSGCTDPLANNYDPLAVIDDGSCIYGCLSGANPSFNFTNSCNPNASYLTWPSYYTAPMPPPQIQPSSTFTWFGNTIFDPLTGTNINSGDSVMSNSINMLLANQGSYCEWCDDIASSGGVSSNMTDYFPIWHDAVPPGGPWSQTLGLTPSDAHCCCCPGQGGGPWNPGAQLSAKMGGSTDDPTDPTQEKKCCDWCATVDPNIPSKPPRGCFDFNCKDCKGFKPPKPTVIPEHLKRALQIKAGIIK